MEILPLTSKGQNVTPGMSWESNVNLEVSRGWKEWLLLEHNFSRFKADLSLEAAKSGPP